MPALAAYAAADAAVLPVEAHKTVRAPASSALATATTMPRSLNEAVGFMPSNLMYSSSTPTHAARRGVSPSASVSAGVWAVIGRYGAHRAKTPTAMTDGAVELMRVLLGARR